jgi:glycosyltransferase involved in cell wall biosynthesis
MSDNREYGQLHRRKSGKVTDKWDLYLDIYERSLYDYKDQAICLLEIGVQNGGSLETWSKFFKNAKKIIGCDIDPKCGELVFEDPRIRVIVGDASDRGTIERVRQISDGLDIVIEDGSHTSRDIVSTFVSAFPMIKPGGIYIAEDLHCCYWQEYGGGIYNPYSGIEYFKALCDCINANHWNREDVKTLEYINSIGRTYDSEIDLDTLTTILSIEFFDSVCIIRKAKEGQLTRIGNRVIGGLSEYVAKGIKDQQQCILDFPQLPQKWKSQIELTNCIEDLIKQKQMLYDENQELYGSINQCEQTLESLVLSTSWQVTKPLRMIGKISQKIFYMSKLGLRRIESRISHRRIFDNDCNINNHASGTTKGKQIIGKDSPVILFISHEASRTGAPVFLLNIARHLKKDLGIDCAFLLRNGGKLEKQFHELGPCWVLDNPHVLSRHILKDIRKRNISLVYSNTATNGSIQDELKKLERPIVCHVHEMRYSLEHHFGGYNIKLILATTDLFLAGSFAVSKDLTSHFRVPLNKVSVAHPFIDVCATDRLAKTKMPFLDVPSDAIIIGACGSIGWRKGTDLFIQVAGRVMEQIARKVHFVWIGGPLGHGAHPNILYDAKTMNIADSISFLGEVKSHLPYFSRFDIFILPSREDPFPLVALDAACLRLPIVCFDKSGGVTELVQEDSGFVVPYLDVERMANAIIRLAEDASLREQMGNSGRDRVCGRYDIGIGGNRISSIIKNQLKLSSQKKA